MSDSISELLDKLQSCVGIDWTDTPVSGDRPYATFDRAQAEKILKEHAELQITR